MDSLQSLNVAENELTTKALATGLTGLTSLTKLDASQNELRSVTEVVKVLSSLPLLTSVLIAAACQGPYHS